ncbi:MAG: 50S ribosomal protein L24 [Lachnospiraceae bacterium]|jgi:large subunit ribosomal protein L24|nr:50S ribosomal protein L24 [Lachnospiraceae bacterium]
MATLKIKKGDTVRVIAGKDNGKEGKVVSIDRKNGRVLVEGINMITKHMKPSAANQNGGIVKKEAPIDISNVMYLHKGKPTRIGFKFENDKKVRFAKSTGEVID